MKINKELLCCYGVSSKADENNLDHVFMLDFDNCLYASVVNELLGLQKEYGLSDIYIIESTNGYNAISLDILSLSIIYNIGHDVLSLCDKNFIHYGFERGYYTLRFDRDKKLKKILKNDSKKYKKSLAHKLFLEWFFEIKIDFDNCFNCYSKIKLIQFPSNKNGYHLQEKLLPDYFEVFKHDKQPF